ncbi:MAG TPA: AAA family ATPase, partial [Nitrolancea sp.]|nr:AAA family ATPase [Nitrolancea sp.]
MRDSESPFRPNDHGRTNEPLVGREREQALLRQALDAMLAGHGGLMLVSGEAGIGKTTLVEWLAGEAFGTGASVLWGHAYDLSATPPYGPWIEIARRYPASTQPASFPNFLDDPRHASAIGSQDQVFSQVTSFLTHLSDERPLVLILDDLHWADQASLDLLRVVAREAHAHRLLLLGTCRSEELTRRHPLFQLIPLLVREAHAERLVVRPLDDEATRALIEARYPLSRADVARLGTYLRARSEGNPLYALELLRTLEDDDILSAPTGGWQLGDLEHVRVPQLLLQMLERRAGRLTQEARGLLQFAAVIGHDVPLDLWQEASGAADDALARAIDQGLETHLLVENASDAVRFGHALMREALYAEVITPRRRSLHQKVAETLERAPHPDPDAVAYHYQQAGDGRAARWFIKAGERAEDSYAWVTAVERFEVARALLERQRVDAAEYGWLLLRIAAIRRYERPSRAMEILDAAAAYAESARDPVLFAYFLLHRGQLRCLEGQVELGLADLEAGVAAVRGLAPDQRARLGALPPNVLWAVDGDGLGTLVFHLARSGRYHAARALGEQFASEHAQHGASIAPLSDRGDVSCGLAIAYAALGRPDDAREAFRHARAAYSRLGHHLLVADALEFELNMVHLPYESDDLHWRSRLLLAGEQALDRSLGASFYDSLRDFDLSVRILEGDWACARAFVQANPSRLLHQFALASVGYAQGDTELAIAVVRAAFPDGAATAPGNKRFFYALPMLRLAAEIAFDTGDLPNAQTWLDAHDRWLDWSGAVLGRAEGAVLWARYHHVNGDHEGAQRLVG